MGCIYKIINTLNGKSYIGKTKTTGAVRFGGHKSSVKKGSKTLFHNALRKYGADAFVIETLEVVDDSELNSREKFFIANQKPEYNMTHGGDGGPSKTRMQSITNGQIEKRIPLAEEIPEGWRRGFSDTHKLYKNNKPRSQETKDKISKSCSGREFSAAHRERLSAANYRRWQNVTG